MANSSLSVIVPTLNEASGLVALLQSLQPLRERGHEVILVDGGSSDATPEEAGDLTDLVLSSAPGRALQMNAGIRKASGDVFLFLHADTRLPNEADVLIRNALQDTELGWGHFNVRLSGLALHYRIIETAMNLRSRVTGVATGDKAMFITRQLCERIGGFPTLPLMEDIAMSKLLRASTWPRIPNATVITSSRRWERDGVLRTILLMWSLRLAYFFGVSAERLAHIYYPETSSTARRQLEP